MKRLIIVLASTWALAAAPPAPAAEVFVGAYGHDLNLGDTVCCYEHGADIQLGVRSDPFVSMNRFGDLRLYGLGSVNTDGGIAFAAAGVAWRLHITPNVYFQPGIGGAVQSGDDEQYQKRPDHLDLGSRLLFEPEANLGYRFAPGWAAEISYVHLSHGQLAGRQNPGMDDVGLRLVHRFGH
jgi:lipid A 3-O-deacylase